jgi:ubiquitin C-terminal hydrolase
MRLQRFPQCIIIHINRFKRAGNPNTQTGDRWIKFGSNVSFPLHGLQLGPLGSTSSGVSAHGACYDLYSVINHFGTRDVGHYTSFCKVQGDGQQLWLRFDDDKVTEVCLPTSLSRKVDLLGSQSSWLAA